MHAKQRFVVLLSGCLLFSCAHSPKQPMSLEERIVAQEAELRTAIIEEKTTPILLGIYPGAPMPSAFPNLAPEAQEGLVYWEWIETTEEGVRQTQKTGYGKLSPEGVGFPFAEDFHFSKIYTGVPMSLTFLYKNAEGAWMQRVMVPGILTQETPLQMQKRLELTQMGALRHADEHIQLIDMELIPAAQRSAVITHLFDLIILP